MTSQQAADTLRWLYKLRLLERADKSEIDRTCEALLMGADALELKAWEEAQKK